MNKPVAIIQARMGSSRLPGKVLEKIGGIAMLSRVVTRAKRARLLKGIVVATTTAAADEAIVAECQRLQTPVFRGKEEDVLDRYYHAALLYALDPIVRITSDCPLIDPEVIDSVISAFLTGAPDYASNVLERRFPHGLDVEVFSMKALTWAWEQADLPYHRIHVTPYLYENPDKFDLCSVPGEADFSSHRWTVDTAEDLAFVRAVYDRFNGADDMSWKEVMRVIEQEPGLKKINEHIRQKELTEG